MAKGWNSEKAISLTALLVSVSTLMVFVYQTNLIREQQFRSVYPHLMLTNIYSGSPRYAYQVTNDGIGPAFIDAVVVQYHDTTFQSLNDYVNFRLPDSLLTYYLHSDLPSGKVLAAGESVDLVQAVSAALLETMGVTASEEDIQRARRVGRQLYPLVNDTSLLLEIHYHSIYDEKWKIRNGEYIPQSQ